MPLSHFVAYNVTSFLTPPCTALQPTFSYIFYTPSACPFSFVRYDTHFLHSYSTTACFVAIIHNIGRNIVIRTDSRSSINPLALRISSFLVSQSLGIAFLAMRWVPWSPLRTRDEGRVRYGEKKQNSPASLVAKTTPRSLRAVVT